MSLKELVVTALFTIAFIKVAQLVAAKTGQSGLAKLLP